MMGFSGLILVILDNQIYQVYSINSHHNAGIYNLREECIPHMAQAHLGLPLNA